MRNVILVAHPAAGSLASAAFADGQKIGEPCAHFQEERWKLDEAAMKAAIDTARDTCISCDAQGSLEKQVSDIDALIINASDETARKGIPVIGCDRLIEDNSTFHLAFDTVGAGKIIAQEVMKAKPDGTYAIIMIPGNAVKSDTIKSVGETYTVGWKPDNAQKDIERILTANNNAVDAVLADDDGMDCSAAAALAAQGLDVPLGGQDDLAAINRVVRGTQTSSVRKDSRQLGKVVDGIAAQLASGTMLDKVAGATRANGRQNGFEMNAILMTPTASSREAISLAIDGGHIRREQAREGALPDVKACP